MSVRIGVDVGGTFTKAVACAVENGEIVARASFPTTHSSASGIADGVVRAIAAVVDDVRSLGPGPVELVAHSTTQAVNSLLEGDTAIVGVLGMGRRPDLKRARKRTAVGNIRLAPGRDLVTRHSFLDVTDGIDERALRGALRALVDEGAQVLAVSEAFGIEDARGEWTALRIAAEMGIPACGGHELTGLYGLEMRTVSAALNASILPSALSTAQLVQEAVRTDLGEVPLAVMRGDGGAVNLDVMRRQPLLTAFSGPAASVAGALRRTNVYDAVVVEVGGTSTNVAAIRAGRPVLSYVRVLDHVTCVRSLDVRVAGVAGGSLVRVERRYGRARVAEIGPRSAHIAGLPYACYAGSGELEGAVPRLISPRAGDPPAYLVLETVRGRRIAPTVTCAANALDQVPAGAYARGDRAAALKAFDLAGTMFGIDGVTLARRVLDGAATKVAGLVATAADEHSLEHPVLVGVGGGAGALVPALGHALGSRWEISEDAEVISSIGDAQSVVRVEVERTLARPTAEDLARVHKEAETAALRAGAAPGTVQLESESVPERSALRVVAIGSLALRSGARDATPDAARVSAAAYAALDGPATLAFENDFFSVFCRGADDERDFAVVDRTGAVVVAGRGTLVSGTGAEVAARLDERIPALVRHFGPVSVAPALRLIRGPRLVDLTLISDPDGAREAALAECALAHDDTVVALLTRG